MRPCIPFLDQDQNGDAVAEYSDNALGKEEHERVAGISFRTRAPTNVVEMIETQHGG